MLRCWALGLVLVVCAAARVATAQEPVADGVGLHLASPAECPNQIAFQRAVEAYLAQPLAAARPQQLSVDVRVQGNPADGYAAKLAFSSAHGVMQRFLEHPKCDELTDAAALLTALAIDPERVKQTREASAASPDPGLQGESVARAPEPSEESRAAPAPLSPTPRAPAAGPSRSRPEPSLELSGFTASGALPSLAPGVGLELSLRIGHFEAGVGGRAWASRSAAVARSPGSRVQLSLLTGGLRACGVPTLEQWSLLACARADWGSMSGYGEGVDRARTRRATYAALGASVAIARTVGRLEPFGGLELFRNMGRPRFGVLQDDVELEVFRPQLWGLAGFVGLGYRL